MYIPSGAFITSLIEMNSTYLPCWSDKCTVNIMQTCLTTQRFWNSSACKLELQKNSLQRGQECHLQTIHVYGCKEGFENLVAPLSFPSDNTIQALLEVQWSLRMEGEAIKESVISGYLPPWWMNVPWWTPRDWPSSSGSTCWHISPHPLKMFV